MFKKSGRWILAAAAFLFVSGCATTRNTQGELDSLNAKVASLEGQISEKDAEIARLANQMKDEENARVQAENARAQAENEKKFLSQKLDAALVKRETRASKVVDSDLK